MTRDINAVKTDLATNLNVTLNKLRCYNGAMIYFEIKTHIFKQLLNKDIYNCYRLWISRTIASHS